MKATKVTLRFKMISGSKQSLYLDFYPAITDETGKETRRQFLNMVVFEKAKTAAEKLHNKETFEIAEGIRQRREHEINRPEIYTVQEREILKQQQKGQQDFLKYWNDLISEKKEQNKQASISALKQFINFCNEKMIFADVTKKLVCDYKEFLTNGKLAINSASLYFTCFKSVVKQAVTDDFLQKDISAGISITAKETSRETLSIQELNLLITAPCKSEVLKKAALFSAMTGLRHSDIKKMIWNEVTNEPGKGFYLNFTIKKNGNPEKMPISEQAHSILGERKQPSDKVFEGLIYSAYMNSLLDNWLLRAGINKPAFTFHGFRHSFACIQLENGTDIYTISKMLSHRKIETTQIYAKVLDKAQRDASERITLKF